MQMPKISVIIPVYNTEKYLPQCLDSVLKQSLQDIEVICVDDGSTDASLTILREYAKKDNRISVFTQKNLHAGVARNLGMKHAHGKYLYFMDSDDWLEDNAFLKMYEKAEADQSDILNFSFYGVRDEKKSPTTICCIKDEMNLDIPVMAKCRILGATVWTKLFLRSFIESNHLQFEEGRASNDVYFSYVALILATRISTLNQMLYNYRWDASGAISRTRGNYVDCVVKAMIHVKQELKSHDLWKENKQLFYRQFSFLLREEMKRCPTWKLKGKTYSILEAEDYINLYLVKFSVLFRKVKYKNDQKITRYFCGIMKKITTPMTQKVYVFGIKVYYKKKNAHHVNNVLFRRRIEKFKDYGLNTTDVREKNIVISLTSYPARINEVACTIYSLLNQSLKPDKIILYLGEDRFLRKEDDLPQDLLQLKSCGLEIRWCNDLRSYTKLVPALKDFPNDLIVTADDDIYYPKNWLDLLYQSYLKFPQDIHAHRCHRVVQNTNGSLLPYNQWPHNIQIAGAEYKNFLTGVGGVLYPPETLDKRVFDVLLFQKLAPLADDIWFWAMAVLRGTKIRCIEHCIPTLEYANPEREFAAVPNTTLGAENVSQGGNDAQLSAVCAYFPELLQILSTHANPRLKSVNI
jgi:glycosyltransferase involved in cell wall biosynthesis